jgi:hypothetical protein
MAVTNRVVWSDGLFIKPQHFQQQQRYLEHQINERALAVSDYLFGFSDLELNAEYLSFGRVGLVRASGLFPDGTRLYLWAAIAWPKSNGRKRPWPAGSRRSRWKCGICIPLTAMLTLSMWGGWLRA